MSDNPIIYKINLDLATHVEAGMTEQEMLDEWYSTLTAALEEGDEGLSPVDSSTLYQDAIGVPHWTASSNEIERWDEDRIKWTKEALEYVKGKQNGN